MRRRKKTIGLIELVLILQLISPIFAYYDLPFTNLAVSTILNFFSLIAIVISLMLSEKRASVFDGYEKSFSLFCLWVFFQTIVQACFSRYEVDIKGVSFINALSVLAILLLLPARISTYKKRCIGVYVFACRISIILFIINFLGDIIIGHHFNFSIPLLSLQDAYQNAFTNYSTGLFTEPAHFVQFIIPLVVIRLFSFNYAERKKSLVLASTTTFICLLSLSGNGIVCCGIIWFCYFFYQAKRGNRHGLIVFFLGILLFFVLVLILRQIPSFMNVVNRLFIDLSGNTYSYTKADYRIFRGFDHFFHLPLLRKIFGIGYKALESYSNYSGIKSVFDREFLYEYLNAMCQILIYFGIIGFVLFFKCIFNVYKRSEIIGKVIIIVFVSLTISSSIFLDSTMIMFFLLFFAFEKNEEGIVIE